MEINELMSSVRESLTVERAFGDPIERDGITVLPVAIVRGGAGGGGGQDEETKSGGSGGGFGLNAKPAGVFVFENSTVTWRPAVDVNRIVLGGQIVAFGLLLVLRMAIKKRRKKRK
jgi:uncharacterized spore protein YtfJ